MNILFKNIHIENFCGVKTFDCVFGQKTQVSGKNRIGKSTIKNAIYWVLYNKLADGSAADGIRPHDENGIDVDFLEISVTLTIDIDGKEISLKKTQKQNWVKDRATLEQKFKGNVNEYEINEIPKKEKDFTEYIDNYIPMGVFALCTNPMVFLGLDTKKRRAKLCEMTKNLTDADVIQDNTNFVSLASDLQDGTIDELILRSKNAKSKLEQQLKELPTRIDEVSKQKIDIDVAELELQKNALVEKLATNQDKQNDISKVYESINAINTEIMQLQFKKGDLIRNANVEIVNNRRSKETEIYELQKKANDIDYKIKSLSGHLEDMQRTASKYKEDIKRCRDDWNIENSSVFDENSLICPVCGQEYPADKKDALKADFESHKANVLKQISENGNDYKAKLDAIPGVVKQYEKDMDALKNEFNEIVKKCDEAQKSLQALPLGIEESDIPECAEIDKKILELKSKVDAESGSDDVRATLRMEENDIRNELSEVEKKLASVSRNDDIDNRIAELTAEQRNTSQLILNEQAKLDNLELFRRTKMEMLSQRINEYFDVIKWRMFQEQVNGGFADVCIPLVSGTSYDGTLNHGDKILAEIDICRAFQKANNVVAPIMVDDSESLDAWRVPEVDSQLIMFRRTDDKEIKVEVL